jgi:hypothetical protein
MTEERIHELIEGLTYEPTEEEKERDRRIDARRELIDHIDWLIRPPAWFYEQLEETIELAANGREGERVEIDCRRYTVAEAVERWELHGLVESARQRG